MKITELLTKQSTLKSELQKTNTEIEQAYLNYHERLVNAGFYEACRLDNNQTLSEVFWIRPYSLPYSDHGEGDYIAVDFIINGNNLDLEYEISYMQSSGYLLISIPLDIIDNNQDKFKEWLLKTIEDKQAKTKELKMQQDEAKRKQDIANLKLQLKNLGA